MTKRALITGVTGQDGAYLAEFLHEKGRCFVLHHGDMTDSSGLVQVAQQVIEEAGWFEPDQLPKLPPPISISRRLIDTIAGRLVRGMPAAGDG